MAYAPREKCKTSLSLHNRCLNLLLRSHPLLNEQCFQRFDARQQMYSKFGKGKYR